MKASNLIESVLQGVDPKMLLEDMTDTEVLAAIAKVKATRKRKETLANKKAKAAKDKAFSFFGSSDVEQAARNNAIQRAELEAADLLKVAQEEYERSMDDIRGRAGEWADIVR